MRLPAARLEALAAQHVSALLRSPVASKLFPKCSTFEVAGGLAVFVEPGSPLNRVVGAAVTTPLAEKDVAAVETFYAQRGQRAAISLVRDVCDADLSVLRSLGWAEGGAESVMVRPLAPKDCFAVSDAVEVREAVTPQERDSWALVAATAFSAPLAPLDSQLRLGAAVASCESSRLFLGYVEGHPVGTGELNTSDGVAWLSADATLPHFRCRGVQSALQAVRLAEGVSAGCELAVSEAEPGSGSQRNMERLGFRVAYERVDMWSHATD